MKITATVGIGYADIRLTVRFAIGNSPQ